MSENTSRNGNNTVLTMFDVVATVQESVYLTGNFNADLKTTPDALSSFR